MLNKEQCMKALSELSEYAEIGREYHGARGQSVDTYVDERVTLIADIICDYFSNPPLKFEQIESGKPIWDNKNKEWLFVNNALSISSEVKGKSYKKFMKVGYKGRRNFLNVEQSEIDFEPNRFYRKEVQE